MSPFFTILVSSLFTTCLSVTPLGSWKSGGQASKHMYKDQQVVTACGYSNVASYLNGVSPHPQHTSSFPFGYVSAVGTVSAGSSYDNLFNNGFGCGGCYEVKCVSKWGTAQAGCTCNAQSVIVQAIDLSANYPEPHFDIAFDGFDIIAGSLCGRVAIDYRQVACEFNNNIYITTDNNDAWSYYLNFYNVAGNGELCQVEMKSGPGGSGQWNICENRSSKWMCDESPRSYLPLSFRLTDCDGNIITANDVVNSYGSISADLEVNFPVTSTPSTPSTNAPQPTLQPVATSRPTGGSVACSTRCGADWSAANSKCGQCCATDGDCTVAGDDKCYADVSTTPCGGSTPPPVTTTTRAPVPTPPPVTTTTRAPIPTPPPYIGNVIGDYRLATISSCGSGKVVSLTFDDGPIEQNEATLNIINKLNAHGIKATFYVSPAAQGNDEWGLNLRCDLIKQLTDSGNEIQSHSWSHPNFIDEQLTTQQIKDQLDTTSNYIVNCGGIKPTIFRPPYGSLNKEQAEYIVKELRYIIGLWNLDSNDWRTPNDFNGISANINLDLYRGDSVNILMHDKNSYQILDNIINLFDNGYQFITQSECYRRCDTIDADGVCNDVHGRGLYIIDSWRTSTSTSTTTTTTTTTATTTTTRSGGDNGGRIQIVNRAGCTSWWYTVKLVGVPRGISISAVYMQHASIVETDEWIKGVYYQWEDYYAFNENGPFVPPFSFRIESTDGKQIETKNVISSLSADASGNMDKSFPSAYKIEDDNGVVNIGWTVWFAIVFMTLLCICVIVGIIIYSKKKKKKNYGFQADTIELRENGENKQDMETKKEFEMITTTTNNSNVDDDNEAMIEIEVENDNQ